MGAILYDGTNTWQPDYTAPYLPKKESLEFFSFVNAILPNQQNETPKTHFILIDHIFSRFQREEALCHRGMGKSALVSMMLPLYVATKGKLPNFGVVNNLVLFSDTISQAEEHLFNMRALYENSPALQQYLTLVNNSRIKPKVNQLVFENADGNRIYIQAKGAGESMRGTRKEDVRPQLLLFDDIMSDDILTSETERKKLKSWFNSTVTPAVDITHFKLIVIGTPMTQADLLWEMKESNKWHTLLLPVAHDFPVPKDLLISSWPDRFTPERIYDVYEEARSTGADGEFFREYMLNVTPLDTRLFPDEFIKWYDPQDIRDNLHQMNHFTTMDAAVSEKETADYTVIMTIAVGDEGVWYVRRIDVARMNPSDVLDKLFEHFRYYRPLEFRAEKAALQQVFDHFIEKRAIRENTYVMKNSLELNSKTSKHSRIVSLEHRFKAGKMKFPRHAYKEGMAELLYEIKGYTKEGATTKHDDALDCLANFHDPHFVIEVSNFSGHYDEDLDQVIYTDSMMKIPDSSIF